MRKLISKIKGFFTELGIRLIPFMLISGCVAGQPHHHAVHPCPVPRSQFCLETASGIPQMREWCESDAAAMRDRVSFRQRVYICEAVRSWEESCR